MRLSAINHFFASRDFHRSGSGWLCGAAFIDPIRSSGVAVLGSTLIRESPGDQSRQSYIKTYFVPIACRISDRRNLSASADFSRSATSSGDSLCAHSTEKNREPDISFIINTGKSIGLICRREPWWFSSPPLFPARPIRFARGARSGSGLKAGRDFHLAFSPEREDPGNPDSK